MATYDRVMLKISGEQLGSDEYNFDVEQAGRICSVIEALVKNRQKIACVVGGGNVIRGPKLVRHGFTDSIIADQMGMLATVQNGLFLGSLLETRAEGVTPTILAKGDVGGFVEPYSVKRSLSELQKAGRVVIVTGGMASAGFTTDTTAVSVGYELGCSLVVKTTNVDGVYTSDPATNPDAERMPRLTLDEALRNPLINVMDNTALAMAKQHGITIAVCQPEIDSVLEIIGGDTTHGSLVTPY